MDTEVKRGSDGFYTVCFKNYKAYSEKKIWEVFERYGRVMSVRFSGTDCRGMVFVRYKGLNETKNCLEDLKKTNELCVRMAFDRKPSQAVPKEQNESSRLSNQGSYTKNHNNGGNSSGFRKSIQKNFKQNYVGKKLLSQPEKHHSENANSSKKHEEPKLNGEQNVNGNEEPLIGEKVNRHSEHGPNDITQVNSQESAKRKAEVSKAHVQYPGSEDGLKNSDNRSKVSENSYTSTDVMNDGPPPLVDFENLPDLVDTRQTIYAKDIVIANLPSEANVSEILHLTREVGLNPLGVSPIRRTGLQYNIPFCHLWVESEYDVALAEHELHGIYMAGRKLLVVRAEKLLKRVI